MQWVLIVVGVLVLLVVLLAIVGALVERRRIVREILPEGSFSGTWTLELSPAEGGSNLQITERGRVDSPLFRFFMLFNDTRTTMRKYCAALAARLGAPLEETRP